MNDTQHLPCKLTETERADRAQQLAAAVQDSAKAEADFAAVRTEHKAKIDALYNTVGDLSRVVSTGIEYRDVPVFEERDMDARMVRTVRSDTGEILGERPMTAMELQLKLATITPIDQGRAET